MPASSVRCCQDGTTKPFATCREECANGRCQFPLPIFDYVATKDKSRTGAGLSVTTLLGCARKADLEQDHHYPIDLKTLGSRFQGDMWHTAMEHWLNEPGALVERRLRIAIDGVVVTGKSDLIIPRTGVIFDHKTTSKNIWADDMTPGVLKAPPDNYTDQGNFYALMAERGEDHETGERIRIDVKKFIVGYVNPTQGARAFDVPLYGSTEAVARLRRLLEPVVTARESGTPLPVLPASISVARKSGRKYVRRDFRCGYCELRDICDHLATIERGVSPNDPEYWED